MQTTDMGLQIREMMYHKVKMTKIMSKLTGKTESKVSLVMILNSNASLSIYVVFLIVLRLKRTPTVIIL